MQDEDFLLFQTGGMCYTMNAKGGSFFLRAAVRQAITASRIPKKEKFSMKIGLFSDTFYPEINGVATSVLTLHRELTRRGHEVHVFAPKCRGWENYQQDTVHYIASAPFVALKDRNFAFPTPITSWEAVKLDFDVVHTNSEFIMGIFGRHVAHSNGCALVHTYHTGWEDYTYYITHGLADAAARAGAPK